MCFRIAVRSMESWLIADATRLAEFLEVPLQRIPRDPDTLDNPKTALINLARSSRSRAVREDMTPQEGTTGRVGAGYTSRIVEFASGDWRPIVAARASPSLARCLAALRKWPR
jgi:hypothetical protein